MRLPPWLRLPTGVRWSPALGFAVAATLVLGCFAAWAAWGLLLSMLTFGSSSDPAQSLAESLKRHDQLAAADTRRFDGRSAFFMPPAPVRKPPKPVKPPEPPKPPPPPPPPSAPREYTGPKPIGAIGELVFFDNASQIKVGEERGGVKVLASAAPWSVKLGHAGGEYDVPLWAKGKEDFFNNSDWRTSRSATPGIEPVKSGKPDGSASPSSPSNVSGPATPPPAPAIVPPPGPGDTPPAPPHGPGLGRPGPMAPSASSGNVTGETPVPPALTTEQMDGMTRAQLQSAMQGVARARQSRTIDEPTRERLNQEYKQLMDRMNGKAKGQSGPR